MGVLTMAAPEADPRVIVAATLREVAQWTGDALLAAELEAVACQTERDDGAHSCPVCQADPCGTGCPLERHRPAYETTPGR